MGVHSGKLAVVNGMSTTRGWVVNDTMTPASYVSSNTKLGTARKEGVHDWTGNFTGWGGNPPAMPGESITFTGYVGPDDGVSGVGDTFTGTAIVESIAVNWNWASGAILDWVVNFGGHLALSRSTGTITDTTDPDPEEVCGTKIEYGTGPTTLPNLVSAQLNITSAVQTYVNSSTVVSNKCWTGRKSGHFDMTANAVIQDLDIADLGINKGDLLDMDWFIDDTNFWALRYLLVKDFSGITANRETGAINQFTLNMEWSSWNGSSHGVITQPGAGSNWWE